jgi:hypothetical protein
VLPVIEQIKASGATSLRGIAKAPNARGIATARGGVWTQRDQFECDVGEA